MANSISDSEVVISSAIEVLDDLLAPLGNFSLNVANEYAGRGAVVRVPLIDSNDPAKTPILTPSIYSILFANAKLPTNKLMVKPIPVRIETA